MTLPALFFGVPRETYELAFGSDGVKVGQLIIQRFARHKFEAQYHPETKKITILNSKERYPFAIYEILYNLPNEFDKYRGWYPIVLTKRDKEQNLEMELSNKVTEDVRYFSKLYASDHVQSIEYIPIEIRPREEEKKQYRDSDAGTEKPQKNPEPAEKPLKGKNALKKFAAQIFNLSE